MKKIIVSIIILLNFGVNLNAQHYLLAAGLSAGDGFGLSVQGKLFKHSSLEMLYKPTMFQNPNQLSLVYRKHLSLITDRFNICGGAGFVQNWNEKLTDENIFTKNGGIKTVLGAEITLGRYNVSWDFSPELFIWGQKSGTFQSGSAITVRYVFIKPNTKKINWKFWKKQKG